MYTKFLYIALCVVLLPLVTAQALMDKKSALSHCRYLNPVGAEDCINKCTLVMTGRIDTNGLVVQTPYNAEAAGSVNSAKIYNQTPCNQSITRLIKTAKKQMSSSMSYCSYEKPQNILCYKSCVFKRQGFLHKDETINVESFKRYTTQKNVESFLKVCGSVKQPGKKCAGADLANCMVTSILDQLNANKVHHKNIGVKIMDEIRYVKNQID